MSTVEQKPTTDTKPRKPLSKRMLSVLREQRASLEYIARNFDVVNGGSLDNAAVNVTAAITTMLGHFRDMEEHIQTLRIHEEQREAAQQGGAS
jgi:flagellar basal body rod protein FlgF